MQNATMKARITTSRGGTKTYTLKKQGAHAWEISHLGWSIKVMAHSADLETATAQLKKALAEYQHHEGRVGLQGILDYHASLSGQWNADK